MKENLYIELHIKQEKIFQCNYLQLETNSEYCSRKLTFKGVKISQEICDIICSSVGSSDSVEIIIYAINSKGDLYFRTYFEFQLRGLNFNLNEDFWIYGLIVTDSQRYSQPLIDILNTWQNNENFDWYKLPIYSQKKNDYLKACYYYSGIKSNIIDKEKYIIDLSLVKEVVDFYYLLGVEFMGDRGYMGECYNTFKNVMISISNNINKKEITLFLENNTNIQSIAHQIDFEEILTILNNFGIKIIMLENLEIS